MCDLGHLNEVQCESWMSHRDILLAWSRQHREGLDEFLSTFVTLNEHEKKWIKENVGN